MKSSISNNTTSNGPSSAIVDNRKVEVTRTQLNAVLAEHMIMHKAVAGESMRTERRGVLELSWDNNESDL